MSYYAILVAEWKDKVAIRDEEITRLKAELASAQEIIREQRESIGALNMCIGGEGSLTTDNLVRVGRLENELAAAQADNLRLRVTLELIAASRRPDGTYNRCRESCEELARDAISQPPSTDALFEFGMKVAKSVDLMSSDKWLESIVREVMEVK